MKICCKCNIEKSLDEFTSRKDTNRYKSTGNQCTKLQPLWDEDNFKKGNKIIKQ